VGALSITDPAARDSALDQADILIDNARTAGAPEDELRQRELKVSSEKDVLEGVLRMSEVQRIGSFNDEINSDHWQMVQTSVGTFIVGGNLYQFHPDTKVLEEILLQDQVVDSAPVQSLFGIAADSNGIYVTDGRHLFVRNLAGDWSATELKELSTFGAWGVGPVDAFNGSVYLLQKDYLNIYKFLSNPENGVASGEGWVNQGGQDQLDTAIDIAIDGNIYVLLQNGTIRRYRSSELEEAKSPAYRSGDVPVALLNGPASGYLYILVKSADGSSGHVVAFDPVGGTTYQLELPVGFESDGDVLAPFENPQDIAVDESTGTMYVVNGDGIWSMRYTLPLLDRMVQPESTPLPGS
jgi:DNA-binding beta-propeller fold protein YncE